MLAGGVCGFMSQGQLVEAREVVAALSITGPTTRMTTARIAELEPILIAEATQLSRRLGNDDQGEHAA